MNKTRAIVTKVCLILLFLVTLFFVAYYAKVKNASTEAARGNVTTDLQARNLQKLCKVWGYTKYTHPAFLLGKKDWDEELLNLAESVYTEGSDDKVNKILYEWFVSLGKVDYGTNFIDQNWDDTPDNEKVYLAKTDWLTDTDYLGKPLSDALSQIQEIPTVYRGKSPVCFTEQGGISNSTFTNEKTYVDMSFSDIRYRLLGLFRVWNAIEYYYPYRDILDDDWDRVLLELIPKMLAGTDKHSYQLILAQLAAKLHDAHAGFTQSEFLLDEFGKYAAPVSIIKAENQLVIHSIYEECGLQPGDVLLELNGKGIWDIVNDRKQYLSVTTDDKLLNAMAIWLLRAQKPEMTFKVLRGNEESTVTIKGVESVFHSYLTYNQTHELLDGNIGLINSMPYADEKIDQTMRTFADTRGLIVDIRGSSNFSYTLDKFLVEDKKPFCLWQYPSKVMPGVFIKNYISYAGNDGSNNIKYYDKPVVILMDETTQSSGEYSVMALRQGKNVIVMGRNSVGSDGTYTTLPLPDGNSLVFTGLGIFTPDGGQTQRIGLSPDIYVEPTIAGIRDGRDELKEAAIQYILSH